MAIKGEQVVLPCYYCDEDIPIGGYWESLTEEFTCPTCGRKNQVTCEYETEDSHHFYMESPG